MRIYFFLLLVFWLVGCGPDPYTRGVRVGALQVRLAGFSTAPVASAQDAIRQVEIGREVYVEAWGGEPRRHEVVIHSRETPDRRAKGFVRRADSPTRLGEGGGPRRIHVRYRSDEVASLIVHELSHDHLDDAHQDSRWASIVSPASHEAQRRANEAREADFSEVEDLERVR